jgi:predicted nucleotidyltransferase
VPADIYALVEAKRDEILAVAERYGITNVRVFGSVARGEAREDSDLDLLVTFGPGTTLLDHAGFQLELEDLLGIRVEVASDRGLKDRIRETVLQEAVPL